MIDAPYPIVAFHLSLRLHPLGHTVVCVRFKSMQNIQCDPGALVRARLLLDDVTRSFPRAVGEQRDLARHTAWTQPPSFSLATLYPTYDISFPGLRAINRSFYWNGIYKTRALSNIYTLTYARCATLPLACYSGVGQ